MNLIAAHLKIIADKPQRRTVRERTVGIMNSYTRYYDVVEAYDRHSLTAQIVADENFYFFAVSGQTIIHVFVAHIAVGFARLILKFRSAVNRRLGIRIGVKQSAFYL